MMNNAGLIISRIKLFFHIASRLPLCAATLAGLHLLLVHNTTYPGYNYRPSAIYSGYDWLYNPFLIIFWLIPFISFLWIVGLFTLRPYASKGFLLKHVLIFVSGLLVFPLLEMIESGTLYWLLG